MQLRWLVDYDGERVLQFSTDGKTWVTVPEVDYYDAKRNNESAS